jgi:hypothetical protein
MQLNAAKLRQAQWIFHNYCATMNISQLLWHNEYFTIIVAQWIFHNYCATMNISQLLCHNEYFTIIVAQWIFHNYCATMNISQLVWHNEYFTIIVAQWIFHNYCATSLRAGFFFYFQLLFRYPELFRVTSAAFIWHIQLLLQSVRKFTQPKIEYHVHYTYYITITY